jgi:hypothetical protein
MLKFCKDLHWEQCFNELSFPLFVASLAVPLCLSSPVLVSGDIQVSKRVRFNSKALLLFVSSYLSTLLSYIDTTEYGVPGVQQTSR